MTQEEARVILQRLQAHWHTTPISKAGFILYTDELKDVPGDKVAVALEALIREGSPHVPLAGQIRRKVIELELDPPTWAQAIKMMAEGARKLDAWKEPESCIDGHEDCDGMGQRLIPEEMVTKKSKWCECAPTDVVRSRKLARVREGKRQRCSKKTCNGSGVIPYEETTVRDVAIECSCAPKLRELRNLGLNPVVKSFVKLIGWADIKRMLHGDTTLEAQMRNKYRDHVQDLIDSQVLTGMRAPKSMRKIERANHEALELPSIIPAPQLRELTA